MAQQIDFPATATALRRATQRVADLLGKVTRPEARAGRLDWTIAETAAHLVGSIDLWTGFVTGERDANTYLRAARDASTPGEVNAVGNALVLDEYAERDLSRLAAQLAETVERFIVTANQTDRETRFMTDTGVAMTAPLMAAALLGELLVHGHDIARGAHLPWPIPRAEALLVVAGVLALVPEYVNKQTTTGKHISYELRFRGGPRYRIAIDDGTADVGDPNGPVDCWISADPTAFLLVGYGRVGQWSQALRGRLISGGRKPWLGLKFADMLTSV